MQVLDRESSVLPGLASHGIVPESRAGLLMARSSLLVVRIVQTQVQIDFLAPVALMEEALA